MRVEVCHWMAKKPPCDGAIEDGQGNYYVALYNLSDLEMIVSQHDVMLRNVDGKVVMYIDNKGKRFRQR